jgi:hypothetical protein
MATIGEQVQHKARQGQKVSMGLLSSQGTICFVESLPFCDLCTNGTLARYDAKLGLVEHGGVWANLCEKHFERGECSLGIGKGQRFVVRGRYTEPHTR